ncbi:MAG: Hydrogenase formation hypA family protein [Candidatus Methanofastidiosum methylothiophilum]|uniref:Hydrogenase formation hypA family protein n=1 Tax=Candidatus Methanofastidiosum methylothiophilum TaxID=1705564 RepID=A0A150J739_9EURY|nr:MAG: Hydrogenase formation hypA family protein [Candidatus Methanofastidiosum methylthiophilus]NMC76153.1 hydrogenase formation protein HypD [Candidatus Methanofastidiosa archaeon]
MDVYKDRKTSDIIIKKINDIAIGLGNQKICHVCGTHEHVITHYGIRALLPKNIEVVSGPGCPVCVTTQGEIEAAVKVAEEGAIVTTFGDMIRVPSKRSLSDAKASGLDVRIVYSIHDSINLAINNPNKKIVHFAIGFETTCPTTAVAVLNSPDNFYVLSAHRVVPPAMDLLLSSGKINLAGFLDPGHVSTIIGTKPYENISNKFKVPQVICGFEPNDILMGIYMLLKQIHEKRAEVENEYVRGVRVEGNVKAQKLIEKVFEPCNIRWRGFPIIEESGLSLKKEFSNKDAYKEFDIEIEDIPEEKGCSCPEILRAEKNPNECPLFGKLCTPQNPKGPCMVSREGACYISFKYGKPFR